MLTYQFHKGISICWGLQPYEIDNFNILDIIYNLTFILGTHRLGSLSCFRLQGKVETYSESAGQKKTKKKTLDCAQNMFQKQCSFSMKHRGWIMSRILLSSRCDAV
jgi:hypothetical protein